MDNNEIKSLLNSMFSTFGTYTCAGNTTESSAEGQKTYKNSNNKNTDEGTYFYEVPEKIYNDENHLVNTWDWSSQQIGTDQSSTIQSQPWITMPSGGSLNPNITYGPSTIDSDYYRTESYYESEKVRKLERKIERLEKYFELLKEVVPFIPDDFEEEDEK